MPINRETLQEWIETAHPKEVNIIHHDAFCQGYRNAISDLREWVAENACDHERAVVKHRAVDCGHVYESVKERYPYCPDCGKRMSSEVAK